MDRQEFDDLISKGWKWQHYKATFAQWPGDDGWRRCEPTAGEFTFVNDEGEELIRHVFYPQRER